MSQDAVLRKRVGEWSIILNRPMAEPPLFDYVSMAANRIGPIELHEAREVDGWISDSRLRRLFGGSMRMGYEWRDACTEYNLAHNYTLWAATMSREHRRRDPEKYQFYEGLVKELRHGDVQYGNRDMEEVMAKARKSGIVSNLGIWEFEHLDEDGGVKHIKESLEAEKDIFQIPEFGLFKRDIRSDIGQPFHRGVGSLLAAEKYVNLAKPKFQAYLRRRYRLKGWLNLKKEVVKLEDPVWEAKIEEDEDNAGYWWWGEEIRAREKVMKKQEGKGELVEKYELLHESDNLAIVHPSFKPLPNMEEWYRDDEEQEGDKYEDNDEERAKADEEAIKDVLQYAAMMDRNVRQIPSIPMRLVNLISARQKVDIEPSLSKAAIQETFEMLSQRDDLVEEYLQLKDAKYSDASRKERVVKAWLKSELRKYRAEMERKAEAKRFNMAAMEANVQVSVPANPLTPERAPQSSYEWLNPLNLFGRSE